MIHNHRSRIRIPLQMVPCFCERREQRLYILCYRNINWITGDCCRANIGEVKSLACIKKERVLYKGIYSNGGTVRQPEPVECRTPTSILRVQVPVMPC